MSNFQRAFLTHGGGNEVMVFYRHFQPSHNLPDPSRLLSASLSPAVIMRLWEVRHVEVSKSARDMFTPTGQYGKFTLKQQVAIGKCASLHTNQALSAVVRHPCTLSPPKNYNIITWEARGHGIWQVLWKFLLKAVWPFIWKFSPTKIPAVQYTTRATIVVWSINSSTYSSRTLWYSKIAWPPAPRLENLEAIVWWNI